MSLRSRTKSTKDPERNTGNESDSQDRIPPTVTASPSPSLPQRAITQTLASTAHLANLLPTGTLLAFQLLTPIFSNNGACDSVTRSMTQLLLLLLATSCFLGSFTDSFRSSNGQLYYGFATPRGMWLFDYPITDSSFPDLSKYKLRFIDCIHGGLSVLVFIAIALRDKNVLNCLYPQPEKETREVLDIIPMGIGLISSLLFVVFPTRRHGIGFPVTSGQ